MGLMAAIIISFAGGPLGGVLLVVGLIGQFWNPQKKPRVWPAIVMVIGVLLLIAAAAMYSALMQVNFSL